MCLFSHAMDFLVGPSMAPRHGVLQKALTWAPTWKSALRRSLIPPKLSFAGGGEKSKRLLLSEMAGLEAQGDIGRPNWLVPVSGTFFPDPRRTSIALESGNKSTPNKSWKPNGGSFALTFRKVHVHQEIPVPVRHCKKEQPRSAQSALPCPNQVPRRFGPL